MAISLFLFWTIYKKSYISFLFSYSELIWLLSLLIYYLLRCNKSRLLSSSSLSFEQCLCSRLIASIYYTILSKLWFSSLRNLFYTKAFFIWLYIYYKFYLINSFYLLSLLLATVKAIIFSLLLLDLDWAWTACYIPLYYFSRLLYSEEISFS